MLTQASEGELDHPIAITSRKLSKFDKNCSTTERKGLAMVYVLKNTRHYLLIRHFKMYTNQEACVRGQYLQMVVVFPGV